MDNGKGSETGNVVEQETGKTGRVTQEVITESPALLAQAAEVIENATEDIPADIEAQTDIGVLTKAANAPVAAMEALSALGSPPQADTIGQTKTPSAQAERTAHQTIANQTELPISPATTREKTVGKQTPVFPKTPISQRLQEEMELRAMMQAVREGTKKADQPLPVQGETINQAQETPHPPQWSAEGRINKHIPIPPAYEPLPPSHRPNPDTYAASPVTEEQSVQTSNTAETQVLQESIPDITAEQAGGTRPSRWQDVPVSTDHIVVMRSAPRGHDIGDLAREDMRERFGVPALNMEEDTRYTSVLNAEFATREQAVNEAFGGQLHVGDSRYNEYAQARANASQEAQAIARQQFEQNFPNTARVYAEHSLYVYGARPDYDGVVAALYGDEQLPSRQEQIIDEFIQNHPDQAGFYRGNEAIARGFTRRAQHETSPEGEQVTRTEPTIVTDVKQEEVSPVRVDTPRVQHQEQPIQQMEQTVLLEATPADAVQHTLETGDRRRTEALMNVAMRNPTYAEAVRNSSLAAEFATFEQNHRTTQMQGEPATTQTASQEALNEDHIPPGTDTVAQETAPLPQSTVILTDRDVQGVEDEIMTGNITVEHGPLVDLLIQHYADIPLEDLPVDHAIALSPKRSEELHQLLQQQMEQRRSTLATAPESAIQQAESGDIIMQHIIVTESLDHPTDQLTKAVEANAVLRRKREAEIASRTQRQSNQEQRQLLQERAADLGLSPDTPEAIIALIEHNRARQEAILNDPDNELNREENSDRLHETLNQMVQEDWDQFIENYPDISARAGEFGIPEMENAIARKKQRDEQAKKVTQTANESEEEELQSEPFIATESRFAGMNERELQLLELHDDLTRVGLTVNEQTGEVLLDAHPDIAHTVTLAEQAVDAVLEQNLDGQEFIDTYSQAVDAVWDQFVEEHPDLAAVAALTEAGNIRDACNRRLLREEEASEAEAGAEPEANKTVEINLPGGRTISISEEEYRRSGIVIPEHPGSDASPKELIDYGYNLNEAAGRLEAYLASQQELDELQAEAEEERTDTEHKDEEEQESRPSQSATPAVQQTRQPTRDEELQAEMGLRERSRGEKIRDFRRSVGRRIQGTFLRLIPGSSPRILEARARITAREHNLRVQRLGERMLAARGRAENAQGEVQRRTQSVGQLEAALQTALNTQRQRDGDLRHATNDIISLQTRLRNIRAGNLAEFIDQARDPRTRQVDEDRAAQLARETAVLLQTRLEEARQRQGDAQDALASLQESILQQRENVAAEQAALGVYRTQLQTAQEDIERVTAQITGVTPVRPTQQGAENGGIAQQGVETTTARDESIPQTEDEAAAEVLGENMPDSDSGGKKKWKDMNEDEQHDAIHAGVNRYIQEIDADPSLSDEEKALLKTQLENLKTSGEKNYSILMRILSGIISGYVREGRRQLERSGVIDRQTQFAGRNNAY